MATLTDPIKIVVRRPFPTTTPADDDPTVDNLAATGVIRGVVFTWDLDYSTARRMYYSYRWNVGSVPDGSWKYTKGNYVRAELTNAQAASDITQTIYIQVRVHDYSGFTSATESANAATLTLGVRTVGSDDDIADATIDAAMLSADILGRIFDDTTKDSDELTEGVTNFFADLTGADKTSDNTAADTALVNAIAAATISAGAANGTLAQNKLTTDGVADGGNTIESTTGSQAKVDSRLSSTEKTNLAAEKTIDGNDLLYHAGNKPTASDVGLGNVSNLAPVDMVSIGIDVDSIIDTGLKAANIGAVDIDASNAPEAILNAELSVAKDDDTDYITLKRDIDGTPTKISSISKSDLALNNVENKSSATIRGELTDSDISGASGFTLDDVPDGTTYKLISSAKNDLIGKARHIWSDAASDQAGATLPTYVVTGGAAPVTKVVHKIPLTYSTGDSSIRFKCLAISSGTSNGHIQLKVYNLKEDTLKATGTLLDITGGAAAAEVTAVLDPGDIPTPSDGDAFVLYVEVTEDGNAETCSISAGCVNVTR